MAHQPNKDNTTKPSKDLKYELAWDGGHNCTNKSGHLFSFIKDKNKKEEIRKEHPKLVCALWECVYCGKVKQSM